VTGVGDLVPAAAARSPEKPALVFEDRPLSYRDLEGRIRRAAGAFHGLGVGRSDRVVLVLGNVPEFVVALHGALSLGAAVAPLNVMLTAEEMGYILADAGASVVVTDAARLTTVAAVRDRLTSPRHVLITGPGAAPEGTSSFEERLAAAEDPPRDEVEEDDVALLAYTAGTTADPKGAVLSHGNLLANLEQVSRVPALEEAESDVVLLALPLFHIYGLNVGLHVTLREGATAVLLDRFDPAASLEAVERHGITVLLGAPPMFGAWLKASEGGTFDLSSVRLAVSGAAALPGAVLDAFHERFGITIWEGYGLTETAPVVTTTALGEEARRDSIGLPLPGVEVRIVDGEGNDVAEGDPGEIVIRGPNVFRGYWNRPPEGEGTFRDGWFRTGDVAYRDDDGYLFIVDRSKDLVIVSGFNVYPKEVEDALVAHPKVAECAVIGVPDDRTGEAIKALVVLQEEVSQEELLDHCRSRLARFKVPREIDVVDTLPHHVTGKVLRRRLREGGA
jgi:long-chain acyl-CoA synthetase